MATNLDLKLRKLEMKAAKEERMFSLLRQLISTPVFQVAGGVIAVESAERLGILSSGAAGSLEGGLVAMVGLHALKEYGLIGSVGLGSAIGIGNILSASKDGSDLLGPLKDLRGLLGVI